MTGIDVPIIWRGRRTTAFVPAKLIDRDFELSNTTIIRTTSARGTEQPEAVAVAVRVAAIAAIAAIADAFSSLKAPTASA